MDSLVLHWTHVSTFSPLCLLKKKKRFYFILERISFKSCEHPVRTCRLGGQLISLFCHWGSIAICPPLLEIWLPPYACSSVPGDLIFPPDPTFPIIQDEGQRLLLICMTLLTLMSNGAAWAVVHLYCLSCRPQNNFLPVQGINNVAWAIRNITPFPLAIMTGILENIC